jgi:hypothetical protein
LTGRVKVVKKIEELFRKTFTPLHISVEQFRKRDLKIWGMTIAGFIMSIKNERV